MPLSPSHSVEVDRARLLVDVRLGGLFSAEDAMWLGEEVRAAVRTFGDAVGQHVTLYDACAVQVMPLATMELFRETLGNPEVRKLWARKVAFVTSTALARMQAQRIREARPDIGLFDDREAAIEWLLS